ncbi:MAG: DUF4175 family protein [Vicinamibacterales bacterium]
MDVAGLVDRARRRVRSADMARSLSAGLVAVAAVSAVGFSLSASTWMALAIGVAAGAAVCAVGLYRARSAWTPLAVAALLETRLEGLDNLVFTAMERRVAPVAAGSLGAEIERQAAMRLAAAVPERAIALGPPLALLALALAGSMAVVVIAPRGLRVTREAVPGTPAASPGIGRVRVDVVPPEYLHLEPRVFQDAGEVSVTAGSTLHVTVQASTASVWASDGGDAPTILTAAEQAGSFSASLTPSRSVTLDIAAGATVGEPVDTRLLSVVVVPDRPPVVRILEPARDLAFAAAPAALDIAIQAEDAEALQALELRYTRLSGSGETFTFAEGRVPIAITRDEAGRWRASGRWSLAALGLEDGDAVDMPGPRAGWQSRRGVGVVRFLHGGHRQPRRDRVGGLCAAGRGPPLCGEPADGDRQDRAAPRGTRAAHLRGVDRTGAGPGDGAAHGACRDRLPQRRRGRRRGGGSRARQRVTGRGGSRIAGGPRCCGP